MEYPHPCTIQIRRYRQQIAFTGGSAAIAPATVIVGSASAARGTVVSVTVASGSWAGGDAAGHIIFDPISGSFSAADQISTSPVGGAADAAGAPADVEQALGSKHEVWIDDQPLIDHCRCFYPQVRGGEIYKVSVVGQDEVARPWAFVPPAAVVDGEQYRIVVTSPARWQGIYRIGQIVPLEDDEGVLHHSEVELIREAAP